MLNKNKQQGFTLIELLIAMTISLVIIAGAMAVFFAMTKSSRNTLEVSRLDRDLNNALNIIASDIQRAGYWGQSTSSSTNPFMVTGSTDIQVSGGNCILLTYDTNGDGTLPGLGSGTDDERYGFRLMNGAIQYRPHGASFNCGAASSAWDNLTDPNVMTITTFSVTLNNEAIDLDGAGSGTATTNIRTVDISITGQLANDSSISKTLTRTVRVYNDKYSP